MKKNKIEEVTFKEELYFSTPVWMEKKPEFLKQVNKVLSYKCNIDKPLTKDCDNLLVSDCSIEIHLDKDRIIDIMLVA